ncbi:hypothetical protein Efla_002893 [Eimeria flavescens]
MITLKLPAFRASSQGFLYRGTFVGSFVIPRTDRQQSRILLQCCPRRDFARSLHVFPSPFHRQSQDPDPFGTARPPAHIPLPAPISNKQAAPEFSWDASIRQGGSRSIGGEDLVNSTEGLAQVIKTHVAAQRWLHHRMWAALTRKQWPLFERLLSTYWQCGLNYDEVTYTLKLHGYILCHRQKPEKAFLVLDEMKVAGMHPAIIRLNEGLVISQMELQDIFCALPADAYQNLSKLAFHAAIKLQRQRRIRVRERLLATPLKKLFAMTYRDVLELLNEQERALCFPDEALTVIAAEDKSDALALQGPACFLKSVSEALGVEGPNDSAELLESAQVDEAEDDLSLEALGSDVPHL